jgi:hypothetical protein
MSDTLTRREAREIAGEPLLEVVATAEDGTSTEGREAPVVLVPNLRRLDPSNKALRTRGILKRRDAAVCGYAGLNGQGKTYAMIRDSLLGLALGRRLLSTVTILDPDTGNEHPNFERFREWDQFHGLKNTEILMDEITGVMDSRHSGLPRHVTDAIPQQRRANNLVRWTGIDFDNVDKRLRQVSRAVVRCRGFYPNRSLMRDDGTKDAISLWAPNRLFYLVTFDGQTLTTTSDTSLLTENPDKQRRARVLNREWTYGPGSITFDSYRTLDAVSTVSSACRICGGRIPDRVCKGHG